MAECQLKWAQDSGALGNAVGELIVALVVGRVLLWASPLEFDICGGTDG